MGRLPELPYADGITRSVQRVFGGYQHTPGSYDGTLYDMENLCADEYPLLAVRKPRVTVGSAEHCNGCVAVGERFCYVDGENVYLDGRLVGTAADSPKTFGVLGNRLLIFPDKLFLNLSAGEVFSSLAALTAAVADPVYGEVYGVTSDVAADLYFWNGDNWAFLEKEFATMEPTVTAEAVFLARGTLYGEPAVRNGIYAPGVLWADYFAPGDAVTVRGCAREENNLTAVIREIDGNCLYFYEYLFEVDTAWVYRVENILAAGTYAFAVNDVTRSFTLNTALKSGDALCWNGTTLTARAGDRETVLPVAEGSGGTLLAFLKGPADATETAVTVTRVVPDLEFLCSANNRLWGCAGDTVYGSKLGDPFNFNVFDGLATDSYTAESGTPGPFTACCSYLGYPTFFKEDAIFKLYGTRPADFSLVASVSAGVARGSHKSLAVAGETLFYLSPAGVMAYGGGVPAALGGCFGDVRYHHGVGGSVGEEYYVSMADGSGLSHLFVYDSAKGLWHREDTGATTDFWRRQGVLYMARDGVFQAIGGDLAAVDGDIEEDVIWMAEFGDFIENSPDKKAVTKLQLRLRLAAGADAQLWLSCDGKDYRKVGAALKGNGLRSFYLAVIPERCDVFRLKLTGRGPCSLGSLAVEYAPGSEQ